jgi:hypothetical protein
VELWDGVAVQQNTKDAHQLKCLATPNTQQKEGAPACGVEQPECKKYDNQVVPGEEIGERTIVDTEVRRTGQVGAPDDAEGTSGNT